MSPNESSARFSQVKFPIFAIALVAFCSVSQIASGQTPIAASLFAVTASRLSIRANPNVVKYAHPVARMVGSTDSVEVFRPFRPRIVVLVPTADTAHAAATTPATPAEPAAVSATSQEQRVLQLINKQRSARGLRTLVMDPILLRAARMHSQNMATRNFFNHVSPDGKTATQRIRECGLRGWRALGENIAYNQGYDDPAAFAVEKWLDSPMHRENMLNPMWTSTAVGIATAADGRIFFTELFLAR